MTAKSFPSVPFSATCGVVGLRQGMDLHSNPYASLAPQAVMDDHGKPARAHTHSNVMQAWPGTGCCVCICQRLRLYVLIISVCLLCDAV
jgi:hypothetical protein